RWPLGHRLTGRFFGRAGPNSASRDRGCGFLRRWWIIAADQHGRGAQSTCPAMISAGGGRSRDRLGEAVDLSPVQPALLGGEGAAPDLGRGVVLDLALARLVVRLLQAVAVAGGVPSPRRGGAGVARSRRDGVVAGHLSILSTLADPGLRIAPAKRA